MERGSGVLMHISSLPSRYGIGTMGESAYKFVDFLSKAGQKYWQILPVSPTGYGDSPYQSYSTFAGNPYFIDLEMLAHDGALNLDDLSLIDWGSDSCCVDYEKLYNNRFTVLKRAYSSEYLKINDKLDEFRKKESHWIEDYAMFMALKHENGMMPYWEWEEGIKLKTVEALVAARQRLEFEIGFWVYVQYKFFEQWCKLKAYANSKNIKIIGDIPIYVARDSADAWAHPEILHLDSDCRPISVAGCPPDYFSPKGQLWGNPIYNWDYLKYTSFEWWIRRIKAMFNICDIVRIDHFRAFSAYYSIPFGDEDAVGGKWIECPGKAFFDVLKRSININNYIIAEDLGTIDDNVRELLKYTGFPGMKVLQFAFNPDGSSEYLPHKYDKNCVSYIGTHDNDTTCSWYANESEACREFIRKYIHLCKDELINWALIRTLLSSVSDISIITMQDILGLDSSSRMNTPAKSSGNWQWRIGGIELLTDKLAQTINELTKMYGR